MRENRKSGSMSGCRKRSRGPRAVATAPAVDSTRFSSRGTEDGVKFSVFAERASEACLTVRRDIAHRTKCDHGNAVEVAERPAWAGSRDFKKTLKVAAYFVPQ